MFNIKKYIVLFFSLIIILTLSLSGGILYSQDLDQKNNNVENFPLAITGSEGDYPYPIMQPDYETRKEWIGNIKEAPQTKIIEEAIRLTGINVSLIDHLDYVPVERNQGACGNCWVWAGTGVMEVALDVEEAIKDRLSIQYLNSNYKNGTPGDWAGCGGTLRAFADFYASAGIAIPWSNTNAYYQDHRQGYWDGTSVPAGIISTVPNYPISGIGEQYIPTYNINQSMAISNIKNIINQDKAIWFAFWLPNSTSWNNFFDFWDVGTENAAYNFDYVNGLPYTSSGGGHAVLCIGYDDTDPANSYWIMVNSWGTTANRTNGIFHVDMDLNYNNADSQGYANLSWETLDMGYAGTVPVTSITVTGAGGATTVANGGTLAMNAAVLPVNATDPSVKWSVKAGTGTATIDAVSGVLAATGVGTVTVTATAKDGSRIKGTKVITIIP